MLVLMQLIKLMDKQELLDWFKIIEHDITELDELVIDLNNQGIELTDRQVESLKRVVLNKTYKSAFAIAV